MKIKLVDENLGDQKGLSMFISPDTPFSKTEENPDVVIFTDRLCYSPQVDDYSCKKIAWLIEPPIVNGENHIWMTKEENYSKFDIICTYNRSIQDSIPNFKFIAHGGTWLRDEDLNIFEKTKPCSFIFSDKNWNTGHNQRHTAYNLLKDCSSLDIDYYGSGCNNKIDYKITGLKDYAFSIAMENCADNDYFSEKIIDCFLTGTVPIYNGTKNISNYFDENGIVFFNNPEELEHIALNCTCEEYYKSKIESVKANFATALEYMHPENTILNILEGE